MSIGDIVQANQALMPMVGPIISAASGLGGVLIGASLTARTERRRLKLAFAEKRLTEFYSPMLGLRRGIRAVSELRAKIEQASDAGWREVADSMDDGQFEPSATEKRFAPYKRAIEYDNKQFKEEFLPEYEKMVSLFREKMHLAYPDTTEHFGKLVEFVAIWKRHLDESLPPEAFPHLGHTEENLRPLYESLQRRHDELVERVASAKPR
jgi:hypothetical protein